MVFQLILFAASAVMVAQADGGYRRDYPTNQLPYQEYGVPSSQWQNIADGSESSGDEIPGVAGRDYPIYRNVPETTFNCGRQQYPGYYADPEANCQAFHICRPEGRKDSFLCPNGTLFNQERLVCDWWTNVDCTQAEGFYRINEAVARAMIEADRVLAERKINNSKKGYSYTLPSQNTYQNGNRNDRVTSTIRPIYGVPEVSANNFATGNREGNNYQKFQNQPNYQSLPNLHSTSLPGTNKPQQHGIKEPNNIYLPA